MITQIEPFIDNEELEQLKRVVESTFVTEDKLTKEFEQFFATLTGAKHAIAYANGTLALFAILKSLEIREGDEVIVPDLTFIATSNAVILAGGKPIFCDLQGKNLRMDLRHAEKLITTNTKAILPVHLYGLAEDMDAVNTFADAHHLLVVEDAAQGVGVRFAGKHVGTFGSAGILSFYGNKTITTGEGGIILTENDDLAKKCYRLKNHGREKKGIFKHDHIGFNFSFTEMQAAIGIAQAKKLDKIIRRKQELYRWYSGELQHIEGIAFSPQDDRVSPVYWFTNIFVESAESLSAFLLQRGIQTRRFFYPLHLQPCYTNTIRCHDPFPVTEKLYTEGLSLPSSFRLQPSELEHIVKSIKEYFGANR
jgi:perosamine synthetase